MWSQFNIALRNVILSTLVIMTGLIVYSIFLLRGRTWIFPEGPQDPLLRIVNLISPSGAQEFDSAKPSDQLNYQLAKLSDGSYQRIIANQSWRPFLVMMYEFKEWRYNLPDEMLLSYASRYIVHNTRTGLEIDSGTGFDCGSGLGMTLIRPWEEFVDTVEFEDLVPRVFAERQLTFADGNYAYDRLTGTHIGDPLYARSQYSETSLLTMVPDDELKVWLYLSVTDYFSGEPMRVYANSFIVRRWEILKRVKKLKEQAKKSAGQLKKK